MSDHTDVEILLVEDDPNDIELALDALKEARIANRIKIARDGAEALEYLYGSPTETTSTLKHRPRLILLDLKLPKIDGREVLQRLKSDERTRAIPVVVLTSSRQESDIVESYHLGVNSYIVKPVDFEQFTEVVRHLGYYWLLLNEPPTA
jgi:two-component system, response regulator